MRTHVESLDKPRDVNKRSQSLISKDSHLVFSISRQASRCQQAFSKPCLVNLISKDSHLVFSISRQASRCQQAFSKLDIKRLSPSILYIAASLAMSTSVLKALPGKLDIKRLSPSILYISQCTKCRCMHQLPPLLVLTYSYVLQYSIHILVIEPRHVISNKVVFFHV